MGDFVMSYTSVFPNAFHRLVVAGAEAIEVAVFPYGGEGGQ